MIYLLAGIDRSTEIVIILVFFLITFIGYLIYLGWQDIRIMKDKRELEADNDKERSEKSSFKMPKLPKMPKIEFTDSHWVTIYKVCGWIALIIAVILLFQKQYVTAVYFVCMGLSSFLAAHILRLLEKGVHHLENLDKRGEIEMKDKPDKEDNKE